MRLRRWLNEGEVSAPAEGESVNLYGKVGILVAGQALHLLVRKRLLHLHFLDLADATFSDNAKVFIRES